MEPTKTRMNPRKIASDCGNGSECGYCMTAKETELDPFDAVQHTLEHSHWCARKTAWHNIKPMRNANQSDYGDNNGNYNGALTIYTIRVRMRSQGSR